MRAQAGAAAGIEVSVAVDDQQAKVATGASTVRSGGGSRRKNSPGRYGSTAGTGSVHSPWTAEKAASPAVRAAARAPPQRR